MNSQIILVAFCLIAAVVAGPTSRPHDGKGHHHHHHHHHQMNMTCKGLPLNMTAVFNVTMACVKELYPKEKTDPATTQAPHDKEQMMKRWKEIMANTCVDVCVMKKTGVLKADGTYNTTSTFVKSAFPASVQEQIKKSFDDCAEGTSSDFKMDNNCASYQKFSKCNKEKVIEICEFKKNKAENKN